MFFKFKHIRNRIAISLSLVVVSTMLVATMLISYIYSKELMRQTIVITEQKMGIIVKSLEEELGKVIELQNTIQNDAEIQNLMVGRIEEAEKKHNYEEAISQKLRKYSYANISVNSIFAFDMNGEVLDPLYKIQPYDQIVKEFELFNDYIKSGEYSAFSIPTDFPNRKYNHSENVKSTITYFSQYINESNFLPIGYLLININKDYLFRNFIRSCEEEFDFVIVMNEDGNIVLEVGDEYLDSSYILQTMSNKQSDIRSITIKDSNTYLINQVLDQDKGWTIIGGISYTTLNRGNKIITNIIVAIGLVSIAVVILVSFFISQNITKPIIKVSHAMEKMEYGNWPSPLEIVGDDELSILVNGFNRMVVDVKALIKQVELEQIQKTEFEINNLRLRMELLQSQINPHFVHNTLNGIKYLALKENAIQLAGIIDSFNMLLRASMSIETDYITVEEELNCVKSFLNIFKIRYDHSIDLQICLDEGIESIMIPKLILQPIVENSAYHGILPKEAFGRIKISIKWIDAKIIRIEVYDNGMGISKMRLEEIWSEKGKGKTTPKNGFNNIGLKNIVDRLKLYYGAFYPLNIESEVGAYTMVSFQIPVEEKEVDFNV
ncbi:sensor histidine kinase [Petrocella sp. FN5]|uniref:sensor histidine kinase n=1 Tax=Petrocella sp. FN5 TaxID=3032002 RepID=UPI0023DAC2D0|nr:histidine kinase [Petrocella sp. FN5]MDF1618565.1 histidine kinase [Petrocella sp. FN5]